MAVLKFAVLIAAAFLGFSSAAHISTTGEPSTEEPEGPKWPTEYYFKGEIMDIFNAVLEPFEIWYNKELDRSRMDVFNGTVKKYYLGDKKQFILMFPTTTDTDNIVVACMYASSKKKIFNFLPVDLEWTLIGTGTFNGEPTQIWETDEPKNQSLHHHTVITRKEGGFDVPISQETLKYNPQTGMTVGHLRKDFSIYKASVDKENVDIEKDKFEECQLNPYLSGEGLQHLRPYSEPDVEVAFDGYKNHHKKIYNENEHEMRKEIFEMNWRRVDTHNRKNSGYKLELNKFADWTEDELMFLRGALPSKKNDPGTHPFPHTLEEIDELVKGIPDDFDWRLEGDLPAIKGRLWVVLGVRDHRYRRISHHQAPGLGGVQLDLSEQSLVDCGWPYDCKGCHGCFLDDAYKYIKAHGIPTEAGYGGYRHEDGYCHVNNMTKTFKIMGFTQVTPGSVNALKYSVYMYGPVAVTLYASDDMFLYSSGIFFDMSCVNQGMNHAVVVVGYGSEGGEPYWIIRNSWGETWGEDGYILMSAKDNNCLVLDSPYYPVV